MTDKEKIIAEIERRYNQNNDKLTKIPEYCDEASILRMVRAEDLYFRDFINSLPAEQPSEELEEVANLYANKQGLELKPFARRFFIAGANWQKEQSTKLLKTIYSDCDNLKKDLDRVTTGNLPHRIGNIKFSITGMQVLIKHTIGDKIL